MTTESKLLRSPKWSVDGVYLFKGLSTDPELLRASIASFAGVSRSALEVNHECSRCGSAEHGQPRATLTPAGQALFVSRSRCDDLQVVGVTASGSVGVDIESIARIAAFPVDAAMLHPREIEGMNALPAADRARHRAMLWTAKEAVLKATGHGLAVDPRLLRIEMTSNGECVLSEWPSDLGLDHAPRISTFDLSVDIVGSVAVLAS